MTELSEKERILADAINAANQVLHDRGITDSIVAEIGLVDAESARSTERAADIKIKETYKCGCWDCVSPGCFPGPCCCWGPACEELL